MSATGNKVASHAFTAAVGANQALTNGAQVIYIPAAVLAGSLLVNPVVIIHSI